MAKDNEKKVSGEFNEDELENVAGGFCMGKGAAKKVSSSDIKNIGGGHSVLTLKLDNGDEIQAYINPDGTLNGADIASKK